MYGSYWQPGSGPGAGWQTTNQLSAPGAWGPGDNDWWNMAGAQYNTGAMPSAVAHNTGIQGWQDAGTNNPARYGSQGVAPNRAGTPGVYGIQGMLGYGGAVGGVDPRFATGQSLYNLHPGTGQPENVPFGFNDTYGDLLNPNETVRNLLRRQGISPLGGNPYLRNLMENSSALLAPAWTTLAQDPTKINRIADLANAQLMAAMGGGGVAYTPNQGMNAVFQILDRAAQGMNDPTMAMDPAVANLMSLVSDPGSMVSLMGSMTTGGLAGRMQSAVRNVYADLPGRASQMQIDRPELRFLNNPSFLDILLYDRMNPAMQQSMRPRPASGAGSLPTDPPGSNFGPPQYPLR